MKLFRFLIIAQASYILVTAVWPLVDIDSFMYITGKKTDVWLVKTVGALLIAVGITLLCYLFINTNPVPAIVLGMSTAIAFGAIDLYYAIRDVISNIYVADAMGQIFFILLWTVVVVRGMKRLTPDALR